ncbi:hypothetical protein BU16DRAFT_559755 [Lophium mytilinum]|uniref:Uncharacterized protein n=1 Tax=Lophium mytilinum TaxID=390894 RepID=A0A6A6R003_9PEZI|nr:hypothetical protein BU16DRAFT_559755 [Lophium mytilinum]
MCKILSYTHSCGHSARYLLSRCRGTYHKPKRRVAFSKVACLAVDYLTITSRDPCGPCQNARFESEWQGRLEAGRALLRELDSRGLDENRVAEGRMAELEEQYLVEAWTSRLRFPPMGKPGYEKPGIHPRVGGRSPLRWELMPEDVEIQVEEVDGEPLKRFGGTFQAFFEDLYGMWGPEIDEMAATGVQQSEQVEEEPADSALASSWNPNWEDWSGEGDEGNAEAWNDASLDSVGPETPIEEGEEPDDLWERSPTPTPLDQESIGQLELESTSDALCFYNYVPPTFKVDSLKEQITLKDNAAKAKAPEPQPDPDWDSTNGEPKRYVSLLGHLKQYEKRELSPETEPDLEPDTETEPEESDTLSNSVSLKLDAYDYAEEPVAAINAETNGFFSKTISYENGIIPRSFRTNDTFEDSSSKTFSHENGKNPHASQANGLHEDDTSSYPAIHKNNTSPPKPTSNGVLHDNISSKTPEDANSAAQHLSQTSHPLDDNISTAAPPTYIYPPPPPSLSAPAPQLDTPLPSESITPSATTRTAAAQPPTGSLACKHPPTAFAYAVRYNLSPAAFLAERRRQMVVLEMNVNGASSLEAPRAEGKRGKGAKIGGEGRGKRVVEERGERGMEAVDMGVGMGKAGDEEQQFEGADMGRERERDEESEKQKRRAGRLDLRDVQW